MLVITLNTLQCIFANYAANLAIKIGAGVYCGRNINSLYTAYSYMNIADAMTKGCDLDAAQLDKILAFQNAQSLTIQTCC